MAMKRYRQNDNVDEIVVVVAIIYLMVLIAHRREEGENEWDNVIFIS